MLVEVTPGERRALEAAAVALLALLTTCNTLSNGFVWDDRAAVLGNRDVLGDGSGGALIDLLAHDFWGADLRSRASHKSYRPLTVLSFRLDHALWGFDARAFHAVNCAAHVACSLLVLVLARKLFCWEGAVGRAPNRNDEVAAVLAALLFAVHPVHCDAVASVVGRADLLCTMFAISSFVLYMDAVNFGRHGCHGEVRPSSMHWKTYVASIVLAMASCVCKELGFTTFGLLFVYDLLLSPRSRSGRGLEGLDKRVFTKACVTRLFILSAVGVALPIGRVLMNGEHVQMEWNILANSVAVQPSRLVRTLSYAHIHTWYVWKLVWPRWLIFDYGFDTIPVVTTVLDPRNLLTLAAYGALVTVLRIASSRCIRSVRDGALDSPVLIAGLAFGIIPFVPASNVLFPVGTIVAERLLYLPSVGFCLLIALIVHYALEVGSKYEEVDGATTKRSQCSSSRKREFLRVSSKMISLCCACVVIMGCLRSRARNTEWVNESTLFESALRVAPSNVKVLSNTAKTLLISDPDRALSYLRVANGLASHHVESIINVGVAYSNKKDHLSASRYYARGKYCDPSHSSPPGFLGVRLLDFWREVNHGYAWEEYLGSPTIELARSMLDYAIDKAGSRFPSHYFHRGYVSFEAHEFEDALRYFHATRLANRMLKRQTLDPELLVEDALIYNMVGASYVHLGEDDKALEVLEDGLELFPKCVEMRFNAGIACIRSQDLLRANVHLDAGFEAANDRSDVPKLLQISSILRSMSLVDTAVMFEQKAASLRDQ